jgi:hypothetical protein
VLNPVRAKMAGRPEEYKWSSYRATAGLEAAPEWLDVAAAVAGLGADPADAQTAYSRFVLDAIDSEDRLWDKVTNAIYLGTECWAKQMRKLVESRPRSTDHPVTQRAIGRPRMHAIVKTVSDVAKRLHEAIRPTSAERRRLAAWIGWHEGWITLRSIAAGLRLRSEGYVSSLIRRCDQEFATNPLLLAQLDTALAVLRA